MKLIPLSKGMSAMVDDEDYDSISTMCSWFAHLDKTTENYYAHGNIGENGRQRTIVMTRILLDCGKGFVVDHKNGNTLDNQKNNIRISTLSQNGANRKPKKNGTSKYLGVSFIKRMGVFRAAIRKNKTGHFLGHFKDEKEAALAYNKAAIIHHGEFARLNIIE